MWITAAVVAAAAGILGFVLTQGVRVRECYILRDVAVIDSKWRQLSGVWMVLRTSPPADTLQPEDVSVIMPDGRTFGPELGLKLRNEIWLKCVIPKQDTGTGLRVTHKGKVVFNSSKEPETKSADEIEKGP